MFKSAVFSLKDILKYLFCFIILFLIIQLANRFLFLHKPKTTKDKPNIIEKQAIALIDLEFPQIKEICEKDINNNEIKEESEEDFTQNFLVGLINTQIGVVSKDLENDGRNLDKSEVDEVNSQNQDNSETENNENIDILENIQKISNNMETEVVTNNPLADAYTNMYGSVKIKNETDYTLSDEILNPAELNIDTKNILIFHTHTCESYTSSEMYPYTPTGSYRTTDLNYTVARVGDELENYLNSYGFNVIHNKTYHDYPAYTGSYNRSLSTVQDILKDGQIDIIIDLHRDAIGSRSDYAPTVKIGDEYAAQIMFVMGTNGGGLYHPNWSSNLKFAVKVQEKANEMYPGLCKPIILRNSRYNQHLGKAACIIEVGATGNTLEQTLTSMKYLAAVINATFEK